MSSKNNPIVEDDDASAPDKKSGMLSKLWNTVTSPLKLFGGLGGIIKLAAVAIGGYFLLGSEKVQGWLGGIFGEKFENGLSNFMNKIKAFLGGKGAEEAKAEIFNDLTPDQAKKDLKGQIPEGVYEVITRDETTWNKFHNTVKEANGGKLKSLDEITNEKSIKRLMICEPQLTIDIINGVRKSGASTMSTQVATTLKNMVKDGSFDELLNEQNRKNTLSILVNVIPPEKLVFQGMRIDAKQLDTMIGTDIKNNKGKLSDGMRKLFEGAIENVIGGTTTTTGADGKTKTSTGTNPARNTSIVAPAMLPAMLEQASGILGANNMPAVQKLAAAMGDRFQPFAMAILADPNTNPELAMQAPVIAMHPKNVKAVLEFAKNVDIFAISDPNIRASISDLRNAASDPKFQRALSNLAAKDIDPGTLFGKCFAVLDANGQLAIDPATGGPVTPTPSLILSRMMNPQINAEITRAGAADLAVVIGASAPQFKDIFTENNLTAILNATRIMGANPANATNGSQMVIGAFVEMAVNRDVEVLRQIEMLSPGVIANFFQNDSNVAAFTSMVKNLKMNGASGRLLTEFQADLGNKDWGFIEVLRDANASKEIPKLLAGEKYDYSNWQGFLHWSGIGSSDVIVQNSKQLESFAKVYAEVKDVKAGTNVSPTATANQPTTNTPSLPNHS